jgi:KaiC/GvpD/RAD55 family RecA-like ATPase
MPMALLIIGVLIIRRGFVEIALNPAKSERKAFLKLGKNKERSLTQEDLEIVTILEKLKTDLDSLYEKLNYTTEDLLIDSYIFEINAVFMKYSYYLNLCKKRGLIAG